MLTLMEFILAVTSFMKRLHGLCFLMLTLMEVFFSSHHTVTSFMKRKHRVWSSHSYNEVMTLLIRQNEVMRLLITALCFWIVIECTGVHFNAGVGVYFSVLGGLL